MGRRTSATGLSSKQARMIAGGSIGTLMEYYDYYLYGLAAAVVFSKVFFPDDSAFMGTLMSLGTFAVGFILRPVGGIFFGWVGDRIGRKATLMTTVIGMGIATTAIGCIPSAASIGMAAPILLLCFRMFQGLFVGGEMGGAATLVVEHAPVGHRGLFGAFLISWAGVANVVSAGAMTWLGAGPESFFMKWGWRFPFWFAIVLALIAVWLRTKLEESDEFKEMTHAIENKEQTRKTPLVEVFRHPKNAILGILIGLPQSIASYIVVTFGITYMVSKGTAASVAFTGVMITGALQIFVAPSWGALSDRFGRRKIYLMGCIGYAILLWPAFLLFQTNVPIWIWAGEIVGFVIPGIAMQATLPTMLTEMFDVEARTTGVNIGYQLSNTLGGGLAPMIALALVKWAGDSIWPVIVYAVVICAVGAIATLTATIRPDTEDAGRIHELVDAPARPGSISAENADSIM